MWTGGRQGRGAPRQEPREATRGSGKKKGGARAQARRRVLHARGAVVSAHIDTHTRPPAHLRLPRGMHACAARRTAAPGRPSRRTPPGAARARATAAAGWPRAAGCSRGRCTGSWVAPGASSAGRGAARRASECSDDPRAYWSIYTGTLLTRLQALWPSRLRCLQQRVSPGVHSDFVRGQMSEGSVLLPDVHSNKVS